MLARSPRTSSFVHWRWLPTVWALTSRFLFESKSGRELSKTGRLPVQGDTSTAGVREPYDVKSTDVGHGWTNVSLKPSVPARATGVLAAKRRGKKGKGKKGKRTRTGVVARLPPPLMTTDNVPFHRRYAVSATVGPVSVTRTAIAGALGGVCTIVNSTILAWASSFHLKRIKIWPAASSTGAQTACEIYWSVGGGAEQQLSKDTATVNNVPNGVAQDAAIVMVPPRNTYLRDWQQTGVDSSDVMFVIQNLTLGTIVDIEGVYTLANAAGGLNITSVATCSLGSVYYLALDGRASNKLVPQGLPTTS